MAAVFLRAARGGERGTEEAVPAAAKLAGERTMGGEMAVRRGGKGRLQRGVEWGPGRVGRLDGAPNSSAGQPAGGNSGGGSGAEFR